MHFPLFSLFGDCTFLLSGIAFPQSIIPDFLTGNVLEKSPFYSFLKLNMNYIWTLIISGREFEYKVLVSFYKTAKVVQVNYITFRYSKYIFVRLCVLQKDFAITEVLSSTVKEKGLSLVQNCMRTSERNRLCPNFVLSNQSKSIVFAQKL